MTWIEWWGEGDIDNIVVSHGCGGAAPTVSAGGPYTVNEGSSVTVTASGSGVTSWAWDLDANGSYNNGSSASVSFSAGSYDGPGSRSISVQGSNNCGTGTASATVNIINVAPTINIFSAPGGAEGITISFSASASDPGPDTLTYNWDFGDGSSGSGSSTQHAYATNGSYPLVLTVTDGDGGSATRAVAVTVSNGAPVISNMVGDSVGVEGGALSWTVVASDPGGDPLTYTWDFGDGSGSMVSGSLPVANHVYTNEGSYQVSVVVTDGQGGSATTLMTVSVSNSAPHLSNLTGPSLGFEGDTYNYSVSATDSGSGDVLTYTWDFGDGTSPMVTSSGNQSHVYADDGIYGLTVAISDDASPPETDSMTMLVTVSNVAPTVTLLTSPSGNEGDSLTYSANATDPGPDALVFTWTMGDGTTLTGPLVTHSYADEGTYALSLVVQDDDEGSTSTSANIVIANVAPTITSAPVPSGSEGQSLSFLGVATDPGNDVITYSWQFGDGSTATGAAQSHTYADDGSYTVTLTVTDGDGGSDTSTGTAVISNVSPVIVSLAGPNVVDEGSTASFSASASDAGSVDAAALIYRWSWGDGSADSSGPAATHTYADDGSYTVVLSVDDGTDVVTQSHVVAVANVAPSITSTTTPGGDEAQSLSFSGTATDPGSDVLTYTWDFGDGSGALGAAVSHAFANDGSYTVSLTVSDDDGASDTVIVTSVITNVAPVIDSLTAPSNVNEGDVVPFAGTFFDVSAVDVAAMVTTWSWGDGTADVSTAATSHIFADDGSYTVLLSVDDGTDVVTQSHSIVVANVAPTITSATMPGGSEGQTLLFSSAATDPGADVLNHTWDFGDGSSAAGAQVSHVFSNDGTYTVMLTVSDGDGGSDITTATVVITSVAPVIDSLTGPSTVDEGAVHPFSATTTDPSSADLANMVYTWSWGDGTGDTIGASVTHAFPDDGSFTVVLSVDDGTDVVTQNHAVTVNNIAPQLTSSAAGTAEEGVLYTYLPVVDDPGDEVFVWSLSASAPAGMVMDPATGELSWTPDYADSLIGTFAVTLTVDDGDGATDVQSWSIAVTFMDGDGDGLSDSWEIDNGLDPTNAGDALGDPDGDGLDNADEYQLGQDPNSFDGPEAPVPVSPLTDEEAIEATPDLIVTNALDPQGDPLVYEFELYADPNLMVSVSRSGWVAEDVAETFWKVDEPLAENGIYWWRARAADPYVEGPWSDVQEFMVNMENDAPGVPVSVYPLAGQVVAQVVPSMEWAPAVDIDGDDLSYTVRIYAADLETLVAEGSAVVVLEGEVNGSWDVDVALEEDSSYAWTVMATDEHGLDGGWSAAETFLYTLANGAPEGVELISPEDGSSIPDRSPTLVASEGSDPEGEEMTYVFEVDAVASFDGEDFATATVDASGTGEVEWDLDDDDIELPQNTVVYARVWAMDADGVSSAPHTISFEVRGENDPPPVPELLFPADGATAESVTPVLEASQVEDPEGDLVFYDFVVARDVELTDIVAGGEGLGLLGGTGPLGTEGATSWQVDSNLNGALYWSARSVDEFGEASEWAVAFALVVEGGEPEVSLPQEVLGGGALAGCSCASSVAGRLPLRGLALLLLLLAPLAVRRRRR